MFLSLGLFFFRTGFFRCFGLYVFDGIMINYKFDRLKHYIHEYSNNLKSNIVANFHHFKARLLSDEELLNALRLLYVRVDTGDYEEMSKDTIKKSNVNIEFSHK